MAPEGGEEPPSALVPFEGTEQAREAPPRVLKPSALNDQCVAPTPDLESHRKRLREAFGNTLSDEFVEVLLGKLVEALRPAALESLEDQIWSATGGMHGQAEQHWLAAEREILEEMAAPVAAAASSSRRSSTT